MIRLHILSLILIPLLSLGQIDKYESVINIDGHITVQSYNTEEIAGLDLRGFWFNNGEERKLGFIGDNFRRLHLKYLSVIKNNENPYEYLVFGKSMVSGNVCPFQGIITIENSFYITTYEDPSGNSGILVGNYIFFEDPESNHAGVFKGLFSTYWFKNAEGNLAYDTRAYGSAMYNNNQFVGEWTDYQNTISQPANWGDGRIPESGDLDVGTSEFQPNTKYAGYGWESFIKAWGGGYSLEDTKQARMKELEKWWLD